MTQQQIHLRANRARRLQKKINRCKESVQTITQAAAQLGSEPRKELIDGAQAQIGRLITRQSQLV